EDLTHARMSDYMTTNPVTLKAEMPVVEALHLMSLHGFRHLPLVDDEGRPAGVISSRDVVEYLNRSLSGGDNGLR
ncbi:MAG: CBS domain-containing protein, partial [Caldilineae bacterium]